MRQLLILLPAALLLLPGCGGGGSRPRLEPTAEFHYETRFPDGYDEGEACAIVVALHADGETEAQPLEFWDDGFFPDADFVLLSVRAPFASGSGYAWFKDQGTDPAGDRRAAAATGEEFVLRALEEFERDHRVDPEWRYIAGCQEGGAVALYVGLSHPELFQGAAGIGARLDPALLPAGEVGDIDGMDVFLAAREDLGPEGLRPYDADVETLTRAGARAGMMRFGPGDFLSDACEEMQHYFELGYTDEVPPLDEGGLGGGSDAPEEPETTEGDDPVEGGL